MKKGFCGKQATKRSRGRLGDEKGTAVPMVGVALLALVGMAGLGIDLGHVAGVANESQTAADIAAIAGLYSVNDGESAASGAHAVLNSNKVNGGVATTSLSALEEGHIDPDYVFTPGGLPTNAVRAEVSAVVNNILLDVIGAPQSTVTREAIATLSGLGSGIPTLPIVIGECHFDASCEDQNCMPRINQVPDNAQNTGWTAFFDSTSTNTVRQYAPAHPNCPNNSGRQQLIRAGDYINAANGQNQPVLADIVCYVEESGIDIYTIPIIECGVSYLQPQKVVGFAKIRIENATATGPNKGFTLTGIWEAPRPGPPGGGNFGLSSISLVK